jgi:photosystem II stability/assembly factor-like uncharacterized protein
MKRFSRRLMALVTALVAVAPLALPPTAALAACGRYSNGWFSVPGPTFKSGAAEITGHAVDPFNPNLLFVTNGTQVFVSGDGGCNWSKKPTYQTGGNLPVSVAGGTIVEVVAHLPAGALLLIDSPQGPRVVISRDNGQTWTDGGAGLPPAGKAEFITYQRNVGSFVYVGVDVGSGTADLLFKSTDGGATFTLASDLSQSVPNAGITGLEVDPLDTKSLWAYGSGGLYHSTDSGASFERLPEFQGDSVTAVDVFHRSGQNARILAYRAGSASVGISRNGGGVWNYIKDAPGGADSSHTGEVLDQTMIAAGGRAYLSAANLVQFVPASGHLPGITDIVGTIDPPINFVGHTQATIEKYALGMDPGGLVIPGTPVSVQETADQALGRATFGPDSRRIELGEGESKTVGYDLSLPSIPVPLDVYFVVDTSSSMTQPLAGIARSLAAIAQELENRRLDVAFGLAEYRSYPDSRVPRPSCDSPQGQVNNGTGCERNFLYSKLAEVGTPVSELADAISTLTPAAGGRIDAQLPALYTTATGEAQDVHPVGVQNENGTDLPAGLQAKFRDKSLRVVIHVTDEALPLRNRSGYDTDNQNPGQSANQAPYPDNMPSIEDVTSAFRANDIHHLGIALGNAEYLKSDLKRISAGAETFAVREPVDCNGDGRPDIAVGEPLVCNMPMDASDKVQYVAPAIVNLLQSIQNTTTVGVDVTRGVSSVRAVSPDVPGVVLQTANTLRFDVTFRCGPNDGGETTKVSIEPTVADPSVDQKLTDKLAVEATVVCTEEPDDPIIPVAVLPLVAIPIFPAPPPPPPAPISNAQPVTQSQAQAQGAAAQQEQEEPQLAMVTQEDELAEEELYAMTAYEDRRSVPAEAMLGVGAVAVSMMYGMGLSLRRRVQMQRNRR